MCSPHFQAQIKLMESMFLLGALCFCFQRREYFILFYLRTAFLRNVCSSLGLPAAPVCCGVVVETVGKPGIRPWFLLWDCDEARRYNRGLVSHCTSIARLISSCQQTSLHHLGPLLRKKQGKTARGGELHGDAVPVTKQFYLRE